VREKPLASPLLIYSWENAYAALMAMQDQDGDPHEGIRLEYTHPQTGGSVLPTMACYVQLIRAGEKLQAKRETGSAVYYVERGQGETIIDGVRFEWGKGDVLTMPSWALREHHNTSAGEDAILFSISDSPVLQKLGLNRSAVHEENGGHQSVERTFTPESV
jgi:gentisate 1,2-dioxygenase